MSAQSHSITLAVPPEPVDHLEGSQHARVTLIEYGDFECPSCKVAAATPKLLLERFPNKVRFIFRHFPSSKKRIRMRRWRPRSRGGRGRPGQVLAHA